MEGLTEIVYFFDNLYHSVSCFHFNLVPVEILPLEGEMSEGQRGLELNPITERGDDGEDGYLTQGFEVLVGLPVVAIVEIN
jgi:hypothetical protein